MTLRPIREILKELFDMEQVADKVSWLKIIPPIFERNGNRAMTLEEVWNYLPQHVKEISKADTLRAALTQMYNHGNMNKEKRPVGPNNRMRVVYWIGPPNRPKAILPEVEVETKPKPKPFDFSISKNRDLTISKGFGDVKLTSDEVLELLRFIRNFYALRDEITPE